MIAIARLRFVWPVCVVISVTYAHACAYVYMCMHMSQAAKMNIVIRCHGAYSPIAL